MAVVSRVSEKVPALLISQKVPVMLLSQKELLVSQKAPVTLMVSVFLSRGCNVIHICTGSTVNSESVQTRHKLQLQSVQRVT